MEMIETADIELNQKEEDGQEPVRDAFELKSKDDVLLKIRQASKKKKRRIILLLAVFAVVLIGGLGGYMVYRFYSNIRPKLTMETGSEPPAEDRFYYESGVVGSVSTDLGQLDMTKPGETEIEFSWLFFHSSSTLVLIDTTAPLGEVKALTLPVGSEPKAEDFVGSVTDLSDVSIRYSYDPDFTIYGEQPVSIVLEDANGNKTLLRSVLTLYDENKKPEIKGTANLNVYVGETIAYREGISVEADLDDNPKLEIDSSAVNLDVPGLYDVIYTATDSLGRSSSVTVKVRVEEKPEDFENLEMLHEMADDTLSLILTPEMTEIEKALAIFRWVRMAVPWVRTGSHDSEVNQAISGLEGNSGDCFTHAVVCKELLERAGFVIDMIEKKNETGTHYWVMINIDGNWYHMDPSPIYIKQYCAFLSTTEDLMNYAKRYRPHLYDYIQEDHPVSATVSPASAVFKDKDYYLTVDGVEVDQEIFGPPVTDNPPDAAHPADASHPGR